MTDTRRLRARAHSLKPVVTVARRGLTQSVLTEIDRALEHHELIKVRVENDDRRERKSTMETAARETSATVVQSIGKIVVLYRENPDE